jgi:glycerate kinase
MAEASGLKRLPGGRRAPLEATTYGTGELLRAALDGGARELVLGIGGSATTDGGAGMAAALGARLLDRDGADLPPGGAALLRLERIDVAGLDPRPRSAKVTVASDVDNPLVGPEGAAAVYGPQKGAGPDEVLLLDSALRRYARVLADDLGLDLADTPGAGAAGGLGAGAIAFLGAELRTGIELVLELVGFDRAVTGADLVVTGEGKLDAQSLRGKAPVGVARAAGAHGVPVVAVAGAVEVADRELRAAGFEEAHALLELEADPARAMAEAAPLLERLAERVGRAWSSLP